MKKDLAKAIIYSIVIYIILPMLVFITIYFMMFKIPNNNINNFNYIGHIIFILVIILWLIFAIYMLSSKIEAIKKTYKIKNEILPREAILVDMLIYVKDWSMRDNPGKYRLHFYPIIKELLTNKIYIIPEEYNYSNYRISFRYWTFLSFKFKFNMVSYKGKSINIGDKVNFYLNNEFNKCEVIDNKILINETKSVYYGKCDTEVNHNFDSLFFNSYYDNILEILKETIICEGIIDIDN